MLLSKQVWSEDHFDPRGALITQLKCAQFSIILRDVAEQKLNYSYDLCVIFGAEQLVIIDLTSPISRLALVSKD